MINAMDRVVLLLLPRCIKDIWIVDRNIRNIVVKSVNEILHLVINCHFVDNIFVEIIIFWIGN